MAAPRILFVCLGNICRSPTAEGVFRALAAAEGLAVEVDSCGTGGWHAGEPPHPPAVAAALARGYDLSALRARQITAADFTRFDRILVMDRANLRDTRALCPRGGTQPELFLTHAPPSWRRGAGPMVFRRLRGCAGQDRGGRARPDRGAQGLRDQPAQ